MKSLGNLQKGRFSTFINGLKEYIYMGCGGCSGCATAQIPKGCKSNGNCATGGCNKLNAYDWLGNMELPTLQAFNVVEVKFKGGRKAFYRNVNHLELYTGDLIVVTTDNGYHVGCVSLQGEIVRLQMIKKKVGDNEDLPIILRKATEQDLEKFEQVRNRELTTLYKGREIIDELKLKMKLSDIEYQADNSKATFFYSADERVDFRELIKILAGEFRIRIEMRQISLRQEAGRLGGVGSCGRELCCSTWLTEYKSVPTSAARYQNLSLNPAKLSGQCGRLKCCLNYELDTYLDALIDIPDVRQPLKTQKGEAHLQKVDIFRKRLWFSFASENTWLPVSAERVTEVIALNKKGEVPETLVDESLSIEVNNIDSHLDFNTGVLTDLDRLSKKSPTKKKKRKPSNPNARKKQNEKGNQGNRPTRKKVVNPKGEKPQQPQQKNNPAKPSEDKEKSGDQPSNHKKKFNPRNKNRRFKKPNKNNDKE